MARRFFYDTEFIEQGPKPNLEGSLDLVSIGIVSEDGERDFYLCNSEAKYWRANDWVRTNVLAKLPPMPAVLHGADGLSIAGNWGTLEAIRTQVLDFLKPSKTDPVELWGYYADYDHVAFCWLFGAMTDLPEGMPMWTRDLKQLCWMLGDPRLPEQTKGEHSAIADAHWNRETWFWLKNYAMTEDPPWRHFTFTD